VDTRTKILSPDSLDAVRSATRRMKVVIGYFDPLLAAHARRLAELREPDQALVVIVRDLEGSLLPLRARAELVAALGVVDWVIPAGDPEAVIEALAPEEVVREEQADLERRQELIRHVRARCGAG
jgi:bifunctional ADP-heptose synthase (sugar kinase/adenylyltransferase)